jgi:hypothetical protein
MADPGKGVPAPVPSAPATRGSLAATLANDKVRLRIVLTTFLDVPSFDTDQVNYLGHDIVKALTEQGITHFKRDFLSLSEPDIRG